MHPTSDTNEQGSYRYVLVPDHQGPRSAFMAGFEEGYTTLDGIRAGLNYLGLSSHLPIGLIGYSGGGHATAWASLLVDSYAPDLTTVAAAYGGTPVDLNTMLHFLNKGVRTPFRPLGWQLTRQYRRIVALLLPG